MEAGAEVVVAEVAAAAVVAEAWEVVAEVVGWAARKVKAREIAGKS